jgi:hypothetical protein
VPEKCPHLFGNHLSWWRDEKLKKRKLIKTQLNRRKFLKEILQKFVG